MITPTLEFQNIEVQLGSKLQPRKVLHDVSLQLNPGEVLGVAGKNGAGKTTLLRLATGVITPKQGQVILGNKPLQQYSHREIAQQMGVVSQASFIPFPFSVIEVVLMGRSPHLGLMGFESEQDLTICEAALEEVGAKNLRDRSILELSGGEQQIVMVARALAQKTPILLLDEPTANLDLEHQVEVLSAVREQVKKDGSVLLISHDLGMLARVCHRIALLKEGRLIGIGTPREILTEDHLQNCFSVASDILNHDGTPVVIPRF